MLYVFFIILLILQIPSENISFNMQWYVTSVFRTNLFQNYKTKKEIVQQKYLMVLNNPSQLLKAGLFIFLWLVTGSNICLNFINLKNYILLNH